MAESHSTATPEATKATSTAQPPVQDINVAAEKEGDRAEIMGDRIVRAVGGGSPQTPPSTFAEALGLLGGSSQVGMLRVLQRGYGNSYVGRVIQAKLTVGQPGDVYEQEADRVADAVMRMSEPSVSEVISNSNSLQPMKIQRMCAECTREEEEKIHAKESAGQTPTVTPALEARLDGTRGGGEPLPESVRSYMEPRFGADFSGVRVHMGSEADALNRELGAQAFTQQRDIYFGAGRYSPKTRDGQQLLAHELTHVVQQDTQGNTLTLKRVLYPMVQKNGEGEHSEESYDAFVERVKDRAALRLTQNIAVLGEWRSYILAMEGFQLQAQMLTTLATDYAITAHQSPRLQQIYELWAGTHEAAGRAFWGAELDINATYQERAGTLLDFLGSRTMGHWTTPSISERSQVLVRDSSASDLPESRWEGPDPRYSAYTGPIERFRSGESGGCQTCHDINFAWQQTAQRWGSPLPRGPFFPEFADLSPLLEQNHQVATEPTSIRPSARELELIVSWLNSDVTSARAEETTVPAQLDVSGSGLDVDVTTDAAVQANPFLPSIPIPKGVELPPPRTNLCGSLPPVEEGGSQQHFNMSAWGPNAAIVADVISRIGAALTPLGPRGYRVLGHRTFDALWAASPDSMERIRDEIIAEIDVRRENYRVLQSRIRSGSVPYDELCPIVDELLPSTSRLVQFQVIREIADRRAFEILVQATDWIIAALALIYPPSVAVTLPLRAGLAIAKVAIGASQIRQGEDISRGIGSGVYSASQEASAESLQSSGQMNIASGLLDIVFMGLGRFAPRGLTSSFSDELSFRGWRHSDTAAGIMWHQPGDARTIWQVGNSFEFVDEANRTVGYLDDLGGQFLMRPVTPSTSTSAGMSTVGGTSIVPWAGASFRSLQGLTLPSEISSSSPLLALPGETGTVSALATGQALSTSLLSPPPRWLGGRILGRLGEVTRFEEIELYPGRTTQLFTQAQRIQIYNELENGTLSLRDFARIVGTDGVEQMYFRTPFGGRYIDHVFPEGEFVVLRESKNVSDFAITEDIYTQLSKDMYLLNQHPEAIVEWRISGNGMIDSEAYDLLEAISQRMRRRFRFQLQDSARPPIDITSTPTLH